MENPAKTGTRNEYWKEVVARHQRSGLEVRAYCEEHGICEQTFYTWRKRLRQQEPVSFALVRTPQTMAVVEPLELILVTGERLRITAGVEVSTLRTVLEALRA